MAENSVLWNLVRKRGADALCKIIEGKGKHLESERSSSTQSPRDVKPTKLMIQYKGNQSQVLQAGCKI